MNDSPNLNMDIAVAEMLSEIEEQEPNMTTSAYDALRLKALAIKALVEASGG